jgi:beta-1,4-mannosyl-glycoprotein beta-1,4-N-acetylglucosaminyltransferase
MIVDCFTFFREFDILELRLRTLEDVVDRFVLCEAAFTYRGDPKPLLFDPQAERFARWRDRITVIEYPGPPNPDPWVNEKGQRDYLATGLADLGPDDLVLVSDCDEIPDPANVTLAPPPGGIIGHHMLFARGYLNRLASERPVWVGTRSATMATYRANGGFSAVRNLPTDRITIVDGGWHFSSTGGAAVMALKMRSYAHWEYDVPYYRDLHRLAVMYEGDEDVWVPIDERFPAALRGAHVWQRFVWERPPRDTAGLGERLEHAHGCFGYVAEDAAAVAVVAERPDGWDAAGRARFGDRFAGVFTRIDDAAASAARPVVVIDGLERQPPGTLAMLAAAGLPVVAFAANARAMERFQAVFDGTDGFAPGRALGRAELLAEIGAAGYRIERIDRVFSRCVIPSEIAPGQPVTAGSFTFAGMSLDELHDFLTNAYVVVLAPPASV